MADLSSPPARVLPDETWPHYSLYLRVREALYSLPLYFKTETVISGVPALEVFTLSAALGATIEDQVVTTLNSMRPIWDPEDHYRLYAFVRQPQTFPDVLFKRITPGESGEAIIMGVELKGWYLLAKEEEPSFRFRVSPLACAPQDLIVVVPWALSNVISGSPRVFSPFVEAARYAAEYRNYYWQVLRGAPSQTGIFSPSDLKPYPRSRDKILDQPESDSGGNFGRIARTRIMDDYLAIAKSELLSGIEARHWLGFFKIFQEQVTREAIERELDKLRRRLADAKIAVDDRDIDHIRSILTEIGQLLARRT